MKISNALLLSAALLVGETNAVDYELEFDHCGRTDDGPFLANYLIKDQAFVFAATEERGAIGKTYIVNGEKCTLGQPAEGEKYCPCITKGSSSGDPHFNLWGGEKFDFHGQCDLVLLQDDSYNDGMGLNIHIRTKIQTWWSHIDTAAVRFGEHTLEISSQDGGKYWLNGDEGNSIEPGDAHLGDYSVHFRRLNDHQTQTRIDLGKGNAMMIETFKQFVKVNVVPGAEYHLFDNSMGMLGAFPSGQKLARDGVTVIDNTDEFGQEWMVRPTDPILFHDVDGTNYPIKCLMPDMNAREDARRRLGASGITQEDAARACSRVEEEHRDACIFDVLATNDIEMVGSY